TEGALRTLGQKANFDRAGYQRLAVVPFESENKFMATLDRAPANGLRILLKGAPDRLLSRCAEQRGASDAREPLDLAFASRELREEKSDLTMGDLDKDLVFLGLVGIIDPPRPEAIEAIAACKQA